MRNTLLTAAALACFAIAPAMAQVPDSIPVSPTEAAQEIELTQLLNQLFELGFVHQLHSISREGPAYVADITTIEYERMTIRIDAVSGQITQQ